MHIDGLNDDDIRRILAQTRRIAVVVASAKPDRPSYEVAGFLQRRGYELTLVNPGIAGQSVLGLGVVADLDAAGPLDMVDVFRATDQVPGVVADAIRLGAKTIWMQLGVIHEQAAAEARAAGITVVMNRCPAIEVPRLGLGLPA